MQNSSLVENSHKEGIKLPSLTTLAGLPAIEFDKAVQPLRKYLEQFDEDGELSKLMLETNVTNHLADGLYVRELLLIQGSLVLSRVHKKSLVNIISKGKVRVIDSNGDNTYTAPSTFVSPAGTQRLVFALEETVWNTAHIAESTTAEELVDELTYDNYEEYNHEFLCSRGSSSLNVSGQPPTERSAEEGEEAS